MESPVAANAVGMDAAMRPPTIPAANRIRRSLGMDASRHGWHCWGWMEPVARIATSRKRVCRGRDRGEASLRVAQVARRQLSGQVNHASLDRTAFGIVGTCHHEDEAALLPRSRAGKRNGEPAVASGDRRRHARPLAGVTEVTVDEEVL